MPNSWNHEQVFPHAEANSFFESFKLGSNGEINWNDVDVKPYCGRKKNHFIFGLIDFELRSLFF